MVLLISVLGSFPSTRIFEPFESESNFFGDSLLFKTTDGCYQNLSIRVKMKMELRQKLFFLKQIYRIYDDFVSALDVACKKYCSRCCTNNVVMTTLEGYLIAQNILENEPNDLFEKVKTGVAKQRFLPQTTTNKMADLCLKGKDLPQEDLTHPEDICPFLTDDECPIYSVRPFTCRCLISKHDCRGKGYADVEPFALTVSHLLLQFIEHIDAGGFSGNLIDILIFMAVKDNCKAYETNRMKNLDNFLISNLPITVLMIPPEHRIRAQPIIDDVYRIKMPLKK